MDLNSTQKRKIAPLGCRFSYQSKRLGKIKFGSLICSAMRSNFRSPDICLSTPLLYSTIRSVKVYFSSWKLSVQPKSHARSRSGPNSKSYCLIYQGYKKLMFCLTQFNCKNTSHISTLMPEWYSFSFYYFWPVLTLSCINLVPRVYSAFKMSAGNEVDLVLTFRQTSYNSDSVLIKFHTILIILTKLFQSHSFFKSHSFPSFKFYLIS